jgi:ABC-2 type transport system permease protein
VLLVLRRDYREMRATAAFRILLAVAAMVTAGASAGIVLILRSQPWFGETAAGPALDLVLGLAAYFLPLFLLIAFIWAFASLPVIKEKVNGNIECLLATPLGPQAIWIGKGLAIFLPGYLVSVVASFMVLVVVNFAAALPGWGASSLPWPALVNGLVINPLLLFGLLMFIILFSLADNPDIAIAPSFLVGFGLMIGVPVGLLTGAIVIDAWSFPLWCLAGAAVVWGAVLLLSRRLTRQNIVLSSKGS